MPTGAHLDLPPPTFGAGDGRAFAAHYRCEQTRPFSALWAFSTYEAALCKPVMRNVASDSRALEDALVPFDPGGLGVARDSPVRGGELMTAGTVER